MSLGRPVIDGQHRRQHQEFAARTAQTMERLGKVAFQTALGFVKFL